MKKADFGVAIYLLAAVIFFIIPIPSILLDVMLAINISLAMIILLMHYLQKKCWICHFPDTVIVYHHIPNLIKCFFHPIDFIYR